MEKSNLDELLNRYLKNEVSEEEKIKVETWLDLVKTKNYNDLELSREEEDKIYEKIISKKNSLKGMEEVYLQLKKKKSNPWIALRLAAGLLIIAALSFVVWDTLLKDQFFEPEVEKLILNDGSLVWLKGESSLIYLDKGDTRYAELKGEGLFEVAKDPEHPFILQCGKVKLRVLGTSFSVKYSNDQIELKVLTGLVNISTESDREGVNIRPNEKVTYTGTGPIQKRNMEVEETIQVMENTEYNLTFSNTPLEEVATLLEKKFDVEINLSGDGMGQCRIAANLTDHSLESALQILQEVLNIEIVKNDNSITLKGQGCQ